MKLTGKIDVRHLSRVEGHGNISISIRDGRLKSARWQVVETPRFFEAMMREKSWYSVPMISGRICGICSIGHTLASIRAVERAFGFEPQAQTGRLRLLLKHMETLQSHVLHVCFLAAPDFLGEGSVLPLIEKSPVVVEIALRLKQLANDACDLIGGRRLHPTTTVPGGFTMLPDRMELEGIRARLNEALKDLESVAGLMSGFTIPDFQRETEFVSLSGNGQYPFIGGSLMSSDGVLKPENAYREMTNEYTVEQSTSKWSRLSRESFAVGALARVNNNFDLLHAGARDVAGTLGLRPVCHNPFMNNVAQLVECFHVALDSIMLINEHLGEPETTPREEIAPREGSGTGAVEVPRGILYHSYSFGPEGNLKACDLVIPTSQNHANIQYDLVALAERYAGEMDDRKLELMASMLVRAYDPCISCSVH
jgi:coenzyme F420-reducing hydrogenase alpha subunit